jgi:hypothetical protein
MTATTKLTLAEVTRQVADEWAADGKLSVPPDPDSVKDDDAFWDEVQRRFDQQEGL